MPLLSAASISDAAGGFALPPYTCPASDPLVYLVARGGSVAGTTNSGIALLTVPGFCSGLSGGPLLTMNEATTVASTYAFRPFLAGGGQLGASATNRFGLILAESTLTTLVDLGAGVSPGPLLPANSSDPSPQIDSLANLLNACVASTASACATLYENTTANGTSPVNTLDAMLNLVAQPASNVAALYGLSTSASAYGNVLRAQPSDWTLFLTLSGGGLSSPTGISLDSRGRAWVANLHNVASEFENTGVPLFLNGITGFGLGFSLGLAVDANDIAWVANWSSSSAVNNAAGTVSVLVSANETVSAAAILQNGMNYPAAVAMDTDGSVWLANYGNASAAHLTFDGTPLSGTSGYRSEDIQFPVSVALDSRHNAWLANSSENTITRVSQDGSSITPISCCLGPFSLAVDASDNVWVANYYGSSISLVSASGQVISNGGLTGGGVQYPNGIALDGGGNVWVANYRGPSITELAGSASSTPGAPISPSAGWGPDAGLLEAYSIAVDSAGSVWVPAFATNTVVKFIGVAVPVRTPLIGPVRTP